MSAPEEGDVNLASPEAASPSSPVACPPPMSSSPSGTQPSYLDNTSAAGGSKKLSPAERARARKEAAENGEPSPAPRPAAEAKPKKKKKSAMELLAAKGISLKGALSKATWGISLAKAFAPNLELGARNRVKVGLRFRPMNELEKKRGDLAKASFLLIEPGNSQVTITNPKPPAGQEAKTDYFAYDQVRRRGRRCTCAGLGRALAVARCRRLLSAGNRSLLPPPAVC